MSDPWLESFNARRAERQQHTQTVTIDGHTLTVRAAVAPQVAVRYWDAKHRLIIHQLQRRQAEERAAAPPELPDDLTDSALLDLLEDTLRGALTPGSLPALAELRDAARENPLNWEDVFDLAEHLLGLASAPVPTERPAASSNGSAAATDSSPDGSSSPGTPRKGSRSPRS